MRLPVKARHGSGQRFGDGADQGSRPPWCPVWLGGGPPVHTGSRKEEDTVDIQERTGSRGPDSSGLNRETV